MVDDRKKKVYISVNDKNITRLAHKYNNVNSQLKETKEERDSTLGKLRDVVLDHFNPEDENSTRVLQTASVSISVNKRTIRKVAKTDMEKVFESISEMFNIPREKLDKIVESNTTLIDTEIKPTLKVANL